MHIIASKAVAFGEALKPDFKTYQQQVASNATALATALLAHGLTLVSGGTDTHLLLVDLRPVGLTGKEMEKRLDEVQITVNKNMIPGDPESPFKTSGIRIGTPAITTRGFTASDIPKIAELIYLAATDFDASRDKICAAVDALCSKHPIYHG